VNGDGSVHEVHSEDVNTYLQEISGQDFSAKDFRTWAGTVLAAVALREFAQFTSQREARRNLVRAVEAVAKMLGNTPAVCRKSYVHPEIFEGYLAGQTIATMRQTAELKLRISLGKLRPEEAAVLMFLRERLTRVKRRKA
jgi:DNA topoisomerase I